jgi:hypothetical protein
VLHGGEPLPVTVHIASGESIQPVAAHDVNVVLPKTDIRGIRLEYKVPTAINGPLLSGERVGEVEVLEDGETITEVSAVSPIAIGRPTEVGATEHKWDGSNVDPPAYDQVNQ